MAGCGHWVILLSLFCLLSAGQLDKVHVVPLEADLSFNRDGTVGAAASDRADNLCKQYAVEGPNMRTIDVYDMIKENYHQMELKDVTDAVIEDWMSYADEDRDQQLSNPECVKLVKLLDEYSD